MPVAAVCVLAGRVAARRARAAWARRCRRGRARVRGSGGPAPGRGAGAAVAWSSWRRGAVASCRVRARVRPVPRSTAGLAARSPASRDGFASCRSAGRGGTRGAGATGAAAAAGSRGGRGDRRGHSTTSAAIAGSAARRATFPQRTRRSSESDGMNAVGDRARRIRPLLSCAAAHGCSRPDLRPHGPAGHDRARRTARQDPRRRRGDDHRAAVHVVSKHDWGPRTMAYEIRHKTDAEYHLIQFHGHARAAREPPAHAADHRRRRALPHHQARARHARPAAEARARAGRAGRGARRGLAPRRPRSRRSRRLRRRAAGPFCCQARSLRDDSATKERRIRRVRGSRRNPGLHSPQQSSDAFAPPRKEPFRAWPRRTSTG